MMILMTMMMTKMITVLQSAVTLLTISDPDQYVGQGHLRKVNIEMYSGTAGSKRCKDENRAFSKLDLVSRSTGDLSRSTGDLSRSTGDLPRRNVTTSMTLLDLREGIFSAQIPLDAFSATADVTVKVIDSSLELYTIDDVTSCRDVRGQRSNECHYRGTIDLPNYIDSGRVQFDVVGQTLCMKAAMKGCGTRPLAASPTLSMSNTRSSSTLDLTRLERDASSSSTRRRKSANDIGGSSVRATIKLQTSPASFSMTLNDP